MRQKRRRSTLRRRSNIDTERWIKIGAIAAGLILIAALIIWLMGRRLEGGTDPAADTGIEVEIKGSDPQAQEEQPEAEASLSLKKDEVPEINDLMSRYFQAKLDQDTETLLGMFGRSPEDGAEALGAQLRAENASVEDYQNISCYTKQGLTEGSYLVYVTYEIKFKRVDTPAPGLMWCYVVTGEDGSLMIRENVIGDEADFVARENQTEEVTRLSDEVNEALRQAIQSDTLLAGAYKNLRGGAVVNDSEGEDSEVSLMEESAAETSESQEETPAETEASQEPPAPSEESIAAAE